MGEHSSPLRFVENNRRRVPQNYIKSRRAGVETRPYNGSSRTPTPTNGAPSRRPLRSNCIFIFQSERSRPFPTIFHYSFFIIHPFSGRRVTATPLPLCRCATFPLTGESHRPLRTKLNFHGRAGACSRRGVRCKLTAGASPRPTLKILFR